MSNPVANSPADPAANPPAGRRAPRMSFFAALAASVGFAILILLLAFPVVWFATDPTPPPARGAIGYGPVSATCLVINADGKLKAVAVPPAGTPVVATVRYTRIIAIEPGVFQDVVTTNHEIKVSPPEAVSVSVAIGLFVDFCKTRPDWARDQSELIVADLRAGRLTSTQLIPSTRGRLAFPILAVITTASAFVAFIFLRYVPPIPPTPGFNARFCVHCGYSRRGLKVRTCPECGKPHQTRPMT